MILTDANTQPLITIITVCYNSSMFLNQCIESVLNQDYQNFEYIILDDNSTDSTWQIIGQYKDPRIKAFKNKENIGEYNNRNKGIELATGKYIIYIDGDDVTISTGILFAVYQMEKHEKCGLGLHKHENPKYIFPIEISGKDALNLEFFSGRSILNTSLTNNIFKTSALKAQPFLTEYKNADTFTRINLLKKNNLLILSSSLSIWRQSQHQTSKKISKSDGLLQYIDYIKKGIIEDKNFDYFDKELIMPVYYKLLLNLVKEKVKKISLNFKKLSPYFLHNFSGILKYVNTKKNNSYWNNYDYNNLNIDLG